VLPQDAIHLRTSDQRVLALADRLWQRAPLRPVPGSMRFAIDVFAAPTLPELTEQPWTMGENGAELSLGDSLHARMDWALGHVEGRVAASLVAGEPSLVARLLLETPAGALLARRGYAVVHGGAVTGAGGAVVIRGGPGAGKSTLVAAAHRSGLAVLGDDAVLVARSDPDEILAGVREVTLLPDAAQLLGVGGVAGATVAGAERKHRLDLFPSSAPRVRSARRLATVLLGSRNGGPARLEPLAPEAFLDEFRHGEIPQERWSGTPPHIAAHWSRSGAYRLSGAADLAGAVRILAELVSRPARVGLA